VTTASRAKQGVRGRTTTTAPAHEKQQYLWDRSNHPSLRASDKPLSRTERYVHSTVSRHDTWPPPRSVTFDVRACICSVVMSDGVILTGRIPPELEVGWEGLARSVADLANRELKLNLTTGASVALALGWSDGGDDTPTGQLCGLPGPEPLGDARAACSRPGSGPGG
jgi:hypothetical protein